MAARPTLPHTTSRHELPLLVLAQFLGTSPWFAVNAVMPALEQEFGWPPETVGTLTSALQFGFIAGALVFALLAVADRFPARRVFLLCALASAACTVAAALSAASLPALMFWRALGGFCLAGIYPVGMKLAAQAFPQGLGRAMGWLVGALVLGSALPHALRALSAELPWALVFHAVALASVLAGLMVWRGLPAVAAGAVHGPGLRLGRLVAIVTDRRLRASVFGYFGHMWELYTMWVLVPFVLATRLTGASLSWASFGALGAGAFGCVLGGVLAGRWGSARVAGTQLALSGLCCVAAPWLMVAPAPWFYAWLLLWGVTVAGDSPQFSTLTAVNAPAQDVGSVLTLTNSLGFAISIVSIQLFVALSASVPLAQLLPWLGLGPLLGLLALRPLLARTLSG